MTESPISFKRGNPFFGEREKERERESANTGKGYISKQLIRFWVSFNSNHTTNDI